MSMFTVVKNFVRRPGFWVALVFTAFIGVITVSEIHDDKTYLATARTLVDGGEVQMQNAAELHRVANSGFGYMSLLSSGLNDSEIRRLQNMHAPKFRLLP